MEKEVKEIKEVISYDSDDKRELDNIKIRRLYLNDGVDMYMIDTIVAQILQYNRDDKCIPVEERVPIIIYINTYGGMVDTGYSIIDAMMLSKTPVYTVNVGVCYSMGFLIYLAGSKRYTFEHATFLMHDGSEMMMDSTAKLRDRVKFDELREDITKNYIISRTKIDEKLYDEKYRHEWYTVAEESVTYGICDYIVNKDCDLEEIL